MKGKRLNIIFWLGLFILSVSFMATGCKKEVTRTQGEIVTLELEKIIKENNIQRVYPVKPDEGVPSLYPSYIGVSWEFSNGFIYVYNDNPFAGYDNGQKAWNLNRLVSYAIVELPFAEQGSNKVLVLYIG